jgi:S-(hydroxymethyl)glutathione dehydrogenase/alcohol dehydrogenase
MAADDLLARPAVASRSLERHATFREENTMKAAVMRALKAPLSIEQIDIDAPRPREVLVRTVAVGVCHSDLHVIEGALPSPLPTVLGHEPAGIVEAVGSEVRHVVPGDHVIGCLSVFCGDCEYCLSGRPNLCEGAATIRPDGETPRLSKNGDSIHQFAHLSAFAERMLVHENALVKIRDDVPLDRVALIGCGVTTGLGAALNRARVRAGSTVAVIGCGGVGLAVIQGCRIAGAGRIIAVDVAAWKLDLAKRVGATDVVASSEGNPIVHVVELTGGGVDYAFEAIGLPATVRQAVRMTRKGGTVVMVGVVPMGTSVELPGADIVLREKTILGCMMGSNRFRTDIPRYVDLYRSGQLALDEMITARFSLDQVNDAFDALRGGTAARSVVVFD